jgi:hypothetical protein
VPDRGSAAWAAGWRHAYRERQMSCPVGTLRSVAKGRRRLCGMAGLPWARYGRLYKARFSRGHLPARRHQRPEEAR